MKIFNSNFYTYLFLFTLYLFPVANGFLSRDFGGHWDEDLVTEALARSYEGDLFIQDWAAYPSALYYQTLIASLPHLVSEILKEDEILSTYVPSHYDSATGMPPTRKQLALRNAMERTGEYVTTYEFLLVARALACAIAYLSIFWLFLIAKELFDSQLAGLLAALIFFGSWEVLYHSRWVATDLIMVQWGLLSVLMLTKFLKRNKDKVHYLFLAGFFAGIATASKYQGGLYWILSICAIFAFCRKTEIGIFKLLCISFGSYVAGFLLLNPIVILKPATFTEGFVNEMVHYASGHGQWTIDSALMHGWSIFYYVTTQLSSKFAIIAVLTTLVSLFGIYQCARDRKWVALILLVFPVFYWAYFSNQKVMIVRNYLCFLPFVAIFFAYGGLIIWEKGGRTVRRVCLGLLIITVLLNSSWLVYSSRTIINYDFKTNNAALIEFVDHKKGNILLSDEIWALLSDQQKAHRAAMNSEANTDARYVAIGYEILDWKLPANRPSYYKVLLGGPYEINFDYYPGFIYKNNKKWRYVEVSDKLVSSEDISWRFNGWPDGPVDPISAALQKRTPGSIDTAIDYMLALLKAGKGEKVEESLQSLFNLLSQVNTNETGNNLYTQLNHLGIQLELMGSNKEAASAFGFAAAYDSIIQGKAEFSRAKNLNLAKLYPDAVPFWLELDRKYPGLIDVKLGETIALIGSGRKADAFRAAQELRNLLEAKSASELSAKQCIDTNSIAVSIANWNAHELAAALFGKAASVDSPIRGKAAFSQANSLNTAQSYDRALPLWLELEKAFPGVVEVYLGKARALEGISKTAEAIQTYQRAIDLMQASVNREKYAKARYNATRRINALRTQ